jgi:nuclear-control-of-ATPase protein 2
MGAIDELMHANQLNLQMLATIPTFVVVGGSYTLIKELFYQVYKRTSEKLYYNPGEVAALIRNNLRDIERLLNLQNRPFYIRSRNGSTETDSTLLGLRDLGHLTLLLHQLRHMFESHRSLFEEEEQERFDEDLNDLVEEGMHTSQQLAVIQRMYHSHPFLQRAKKTSRWTLK